jgi:3-hydroxybutyryl-CoA dehydratase
VNSLTIQELALGDAASFSKTISESDVYLFAGISGDFNPVHVDAEFAKESIFGARVAHGALTVSLGAGILGTELPGLGTIAVSAQYNFRAPVFIGDTITARGEVVALDLERNRATIALTWTNQTGIVVADGEAVVLPPRRKQGGGGVTG